MRTCSKLFADIPFAHRAPKHDGHCAFVHGHNWSFMVKFSATALDRNGFVMDFGKLDSVRDWIRQTLDHALVLNADDPALTVCFLPGDGITWKLTLIPDCSAEGLAEYFAQKVQQIIDLETGGRVKVAKVICFEDSKNAAAWTP